MYHFRTCEIKKSKRVELATKKKNIHMRDRQAARQIFNLGKIERLIGGGKSIGR